MKRTRTFSPYATEAAKLLGARVAAARRERRWSAQELAERAGISPFTLSKVERGDMTASLGVAFELAALLGLPLFYDDRTQLTGELERAEDRLALLPRRVRPTSGSVKDDF